MSRSLARQLRGARGRRSVQGRRLAVERLAEHPLAQPARIDAERLTDVLEGKDVAAVLRGEPGERLPPQVECSPLGRPGVLEERPDAVLQHRQQEPALATGRFGTAVDRLVAHADLPVKAGHVGGRVAGVAERGAAAGRGCRGARRNRGGCKVVALRSPWAAVRPALHVAMAVYSAAVDGRATIVGLTDFAPQKEVRN